MKFSVSLSLYCPLDHYPSIFSLPFSFTFPPFYIPLIMSPPPWRWPIFPYLWGMYFAICNLFMYISVFIPFEPVVNFDRCCNIIKKIDSASPR